MLIKRLYQNVTNKNYHCYKLVLIQFMVSLQQVYTRCNVMLEVKLRFIRLCVVLPQMTLMIQTRYFGKLFQIRSHRWKHHQQPSISRITCKTIRNSSDKNTCEVHNISRVILHLSECSTLKQVSCHNTGEVLNIRKAIIVLIILYHIVLDMGHVQNT